MVTKTIIELLINDNNNICNSDMVIHNNNNDISDEQNIGIDLDNE